MRYRNLIATGAIVAANVMSTAPMTFATTALGSCIQFENAAGSAITVTDVHCDTESTRTHSATINVKLTTATINAILDQVPGEGDDANDAYLSTFFIGFRPTSYAEDSSARAKYGVNLNVAKGSSFSLSNITNMTEEGADLLSYTQWIPGFTVQYRASDGTWKTSTNVNAKDAQTKKSIGEDLVSLVDGVSRVEDLVYGTHFRVVANTDKDTHMAWELVTEEGEEEAELPAHEYLKLTYNVQGPVLFDGAYYPELTPAIFENATSSSVISLYESASLTAGEETTIELPAGAKLNIAEGAALTIGNNVTFAANAEDVSGDVVVASESTGATEYYYNATITSDTNGSVTLTPETNEDGEIIPSERPNHFKAGDTVKLTITPASGYELANIQYTYVNGEMGSAGDVDLSSNHKSGTFTMPDGAVTVNATFRQSTPSSSTTTPTTPGTSTGDGSTNNPDASGPSDNKPGNDSNTGTDSTNKPGTSTTGPALANESAASQVLSETLADVIKNDPVIANAIKGASKVEATITTRDIASTAVPTATRTTISNAATSFNRNTRIASYFDITVDVLADGKDVGDIHELKSPVRFVVDLPQNLPAVASGYRRTYNVIRMHNGVADVLNATLSADGKSISFQSDKFSTYALVYTDVRSLGATVGDTAGTFGADNNAAPVAFTGLMSSLGAIAFAIRKAIKREQ